MQFRKQRLPLASKYRFLRQSKKRYVSSFLCFVSCINIGYLQAKLLGFSGDREGALAIVNSLTVTIPLTETAKTGKKEDTVWSYILCIVDLFLIIL